MMRFDFGIRHRSGPALMIGTENVANGRVVMRWYGLSIGAFFFGVVRAHRWAEWGDGE